MIFSTFTFEQANRNILPPAVDLQCEEALQREERESVADRRTTTINTNRLTFPLRQPKDESPAS
jgi:hypothetical protein